LPIGKPQVFWQNRVHQRQSHRDHRCVVCTGRTTRRARSEYDRPETIEETAELVSRLGGTGIAVAVDHLDSDQVKHLVERIRRDHDRIDVLVNDIWGAERLKGGPAECNRPIWKLDLDKGLRILRLAIDTHLITSHHLLPLLLERPGGLLVEMTDGTADYNASRYRLSVFYDLAKAAMNRLAFSQGHELKPYGATAVAITPGWLRSEMMLDNYRVVFGSMFQLWPLLVVVAMDDERTGALCDSNQFACAGTVLASSSSLSGKRLAFRGRAGIPQEWHQSQAVPGRFEVSAAELIDGPEHGRSFPAAGFHENLSHWIAS